MTRTKQVKGKKVQAKKLEYLSLNLFLRQPKKRLNAKQIIKKLKVKNSSDSVQVALDKLEKKGKIEHVKDKKYRLSRDFAFHENSEVETHDGYVDMTRSGAGYIVCEGLDQDIYVPARRLLKAMHGDKVRVQVRSRSGRKPEGEVIAILERATEKFIGNFQKSKNYGFVVPDNLQHPFDIYVYPENQGDAEDGNKVMVRVVDWPSRPGHNPVGVIEKVLDETDTHNVMMESILINHGFDMDFPSGVEKEANQLERVIRDDVISKRKDLRQVTTFTIDPSTAKDFDDALSLRYLENGHMEVGIHIADVSHYVQPGTALDKEALKRSTSVYLVDRVAPMLPEILSNELCSLRPDEDSLTFSALFEFDKDHNIVRRWFGKSVIHSDRRFAYEEAQEAINGAQSSYRKELLALNKLAKVLRARRMNEGSIAFESPEIQFELDENNHPIAIKTKERLDTHLLVEDFMLLANREVAQYISKKSEQEIPFVYRIHDKPDQEKLQEYSLFLKELGFNFDYQSPDNIRDSFNRLSKEAKKDEVLAFAEPFAVRSDTLDWALNTILISLRPSGVMQTCWYTGYWKKTWATPTAQKKWSLSKSACT